MADFNGTGDVTLPALSASATGEVRVQWVKGTGDVTLPALSASATGEVRVQWVKGTGDVTLPALSASAIGEVRVQWVKGTGDITLPALSASANAFFGDPPIGGDASRLVESPLWDSSPWSFDHDPSVWDKPWTLFPTPATDTTYGTIYDAILSGAWTDTQPIEEPVLAGTGTLFGMFVQDYYNRIHVLPPYINVGNLLSDQTYPVEIWNAYFEPQTMETITETDTYGIELTGIPAPAVYNALESKIYDILVTTEGPNEIDANYVFNFVPMGVRLDIRGQRAVVWYFAPQRNFTETLEWKTDIVRSYDGEQRLCLRPMPRQELTYDFIYDGHRFSKAKALLHAWNNLMFGVPVWSDAQYIGKIDAGNTAISVDTTFSDFRDGANVLLYESEDLYEGLQVDTVTDSEIGLTLTTVENYQRAFVVPLVGGRLPSGATFSRIGKDVTTCSTSFLITDSVDLANSVYPQHLGFDVMTDCSIRNPSLAEQSFREMDTVDNQIGDIFIDPTHSFNRHIQTITWEPTTRQELWTVRQWVHSRYGMQKAFWLPSWNSDLDVQIQIESAADAITVKNIGYSDYYDIRDIMIRTTSGAEVYRRVTGGTENPDGTELLSLDAAVGITIPLNEIAVVCFMSHVRFNTDRVEFSYRETKATLISVPVIEVSPDESV